MKVIVAGSRGFRDYELVCKTLDDMKISTIISRCARGADKLGERYAHERGIPLEQFPARWERASSEMWKWLNRLIAWSPSGMGLAPAPNT
jgi:hypothetical protein